MMAPEKPEDVGCRTDDPAYQSQQARHLRAQSMQFL
jgi:hypothetical protein